MRIPTRTLAASVALGILSACADSGAIAGPSDESSGLEADSSAAALVPAATALSDAERASLLYMREEEKLARDVYLLGAANLQVFSNIARSEQMHMDAVLSLLERYALEDPVADHPEGVFADAELQGLYNTLAARSEDSVIEALRVGAEIEEIDLVDLDAALDDVAHPDIARVYENLAKGSRNHLRAFYRNLSMRGIRYVPQHLDAATFEAIVSSANETGMRRGR